MERPNLTLRSALLLFCLLLAGLVVASGAAAASSADRALVRAATDAATCRLPSACAAAQRRLQAAGARLGNGTRAASRADQRAPAANISGATLRWNRVAGVRRYVVVRRAKGERAVFSVVGGLSTGVVAGASYAVRTAVVGSVWSASRTLAVAAPPVDVAGPSTPPVAAAAGSSPTPASSPAAPVSPPVPAGSADPFEFGLNSGSALLWELGFMGPLAPKHVRAEVPIGSSVDALAPIVEAYARAGAQPLLVAHVAGRVPTAAEAANVGRWAAAFGPGGTFWQGRSYPAGVAVTEIEFLNEVNNPWNYAEGSKGPDWYVDPAFLQRARDYAVRVREAGLAVRAANPAVGILAVGDEYAGYTTWMDAMLAQVPDLADYVKGWTIHPYGPDWQLTMDALLAATRGITQRPMYATEWGLATDGGTCLSDNFGWDTCLGSAAAATALNGAVAGMRARYGSRLAAVYLYSGRDLGIHGLTTDREMFFGALRYDGSSKGAYTDAVKALLAAST